MLHRTGRAYFSAPFSCALFFGGAPSCFSAGKREKEATRTWRESRTLSPRKSAGLQDPKPSKECWVAKP